MYNMIFKRKSFHVFRNYKTEEIYSDLYKLTKEEINDIVNSFKTFKPLYEDIKVNMEIVTNDKTNCKRGQEYCILFYSEIKENYLQNIGYIGEQLDLFLTSKNIGTLWFGIGKVKENIKNDLTYVTMMAICKVPENSFRKDMFKSKRKDLKAIYDGNKYDSVINVARFAPSSCNTQPWHIEDTDKGMVISRYREPGKRGIMPINKVVYQNLIDIGIFIYFVDLCLQKNEYKYQRELFADWETNDKETTKIAEYTIS